MVIGSRSRNMLIAATVLASACSSSASTESSPTATTAAADAQRAPIGVDADGDEIASLAVEVPTGPLAPDVVADLDSVLSTLQTGIDVDAIARLGQSGDVRVAWLLADLLRFVGADTSAALGESFNSLAGTDLEIGSTLWGATTDLLIAWDIPEPPGYVTWKRQAFELVEPGWAPFFDDTEATIDWRLVSWGGVLIDDRPIEATDQPCPQSCIPALDDPLVTGVDGGDWYPDDRVVFGITINGESRAYPKHQMEVHEMVNDTVGGRRIGIPYCTLCGSAQAYFTDDTAGYDVLELRTSGLLIRSNKVMYELTTLSVLDTFTGEAVTGPLREAGVVLDQATVVTTTWGDWKLHHPETTILAEDGGVGRTYSLDPLRGRDDNGPIFPIGDVDTRLGVQSPVVGVIGPDGSPVAFEVRAAQSALRDGGSVETAGVALIADGDGLRAITVDGVALASHQAFWFAWSQFHPDTELWIG